VEKVESRHMCCIVCCRNTPDLQCIYAKARRAETLLQITLAAETKTIKRFRVPLCVIVVKRNKRDNFRRKDMPLHKCERGIWNLKSV